MRQSRITQCMEKGLKTLQNMGRPRRSGLRQESPTSHQSGEPADDPFFVDPEHASHAAASLGFAPAGLPPSSYAPHFPSAYAHPRSRQASVAPPPAMLPGTAPTSMATGGHRYSLSNSSNYGPTAPPVPTSAGGYGGMGFSPTSAYTGQGLPAPPLPSFSRPFEPTAPSTGPSLPSLHSFLQSPREPMSATSY